MAKRIKLGRVEYVRRSERLIALRFLQRAIRYAKANYRCDSAGKLADIHRICLWRVVVAASHKSGTFDGKRPHHKGGSDARS